MGFVGSQSTHRCLGGDADFYLPPPMLRIYASHVPGCTSEIFAEGGDTDHFYKVVSGVVRVCKFLNDGRRRIEAFHVEGEAFGLELGDQRLLSAEAVSDCTLIAYRRRTDRTVERRVETTLDSRFGGTWRMIVYVNTASYAEHVALVKGDVSSDEPVLVRMHALNIIDDVLGDKAAGRGDILHAWRIITTTATIMRANGGCSPASR